MDRLHIKLFIIIMVFISLLVAGFMVPSKLVIPVLHATRNDWNHHTFWMPWGKSRVHKGIDIFAGEGTPVISSCPGVVLYTGYLSQGGNVFIVLGPKWRLHYYAHMKTMKIRAIQWVSAGEEIGAVGSTGNAAGKPPHLHYAIVSLIPRVGHLAFDQHGMARIFYVNPHEELIRL